MASEVISSFELARTKFKEHLNNVPEYRALLAIDKLISDVSIDLGVQAAPAQTALAKIETEMLPPEIARAEPEPPVTAAVQATGQPEVAEIGSPHEAAATEPEPDLAVSAAEHLIPQPETAQIAAPQEVGVTDAGLAVSATEYPITQPEIAEITATPLPAPPFDDGSEKAA